MNTISSSSFRVPLSSSSFEPSPSHPQSHSLGFCVPRALHTPSVHSLRLRVSSKSRSSAFSVEREASDADEEFDDDEDDEEDDDDVAADEYDEFSGDESEGVDQSDDEIELELSVAAAEAPPRTEQFKWQRVEKLRNEVREFGEEIIDVDELVSIYDFRIDKFQVKFVISACISVG